MSHSAQHSIVSSPVSSEGNTPQRLSNLYQYHNAPEVAPAAGLEYDDSIHPYSDKYPVVNTSQYTASTLKGRSVESVGTSKPPVIIFGMKLRTFFIVSFIVVLIIIGAAVGGALGRPKAAQAMPVTTSSPTTHPNQTLMPETTSATPTATAITSTFNAPIPTYSVLNDCPQSNNTLFTTRPVSTTDSTTFNYTKHCDLDSPLSANGARTLSTAFVYSFNDCIQVCASLNIFTNSNNCTSAVFVLDGERPANCFVGTADVSRGASAFAGRRGVNVALLQEG
ncbi:hypothetical protein BDZ85DRAFT_261978 [Elsinoe ampelina]|uniref:Apple domain-containing protein n=1 Tax=Elsinoe ampelina TaxID=302913 RepID=A0A6A6GDG1_9PEZI|nr:hypothetical protein BDZ85DRAFT_261978 [Elsinoe ampelina]